MDLKKIPTDELFRKFAGSRLTGHWDSNNVGRGKTTVKKTAQTRKEITQELTKRFFGETPLPTKYDLALELAPDMYALQRGDPPSLALKVLLSACLSPANPNATKDDLLRNCILKTPCVNLQNQVFITDLPPEILVIIAAFIPKLSDIAKASMTCRKLRGILWGNTALFRGWVTKSIVGRGPYPQELVFPGVKKAYPELYFRAFLEDPVRPKSKIPWEEVAFRWFSWTLLFYNHPKKVVEHTNTSKTTQQFCLLDKHIGYNSRLFCANCRRVPKRVYAKNTLSVTFDNSVFGFNYMTVCGICWSYSTRSTGVLPLKLALKVADLQQNNDLLNHRSFCLPWDHHRNYARHDSSPMVTIETVIHAMQIHRKDTGDLLSNTRYIFKTPAEYGLYLKTKKAVVAEIERNWNGSLKTQTGTTLPPPQKKPRLGDL